MQVLTNESLKDTFVVGIDISIALYILDIDYYSMKLSKMRQWLRLQLKSEVHDLGLSSDYETVSQCTRTDMVQSRWIIFHVKIQKPIFFPLDKLEKTFFVSFVHTMKTKIRLKI